MNKKMTTNSSFDMTSSNHPKLYVPSVEFGNNFTIELWIKPDAVPTLTNSKIFMFFPDGGPQLTIAYTTSNVYQFYMNGGGTLYSIFPNMILNEWHHLAITVDNYDINTYYDGELYGSYTVGSTNGYSSRDLYIGYDPSLPRDTYAYMNNFRLWNYTRTSTEIQENYNLNIPTDTTGLVFDFRASEGTLTSTSILDSTGTYTASSSTNTSVVISTYTYPTYTTYTTSDSFSGDSMNISGSYTVDSVSSTSSIGINVTSPEAMLHVSGGISATELLISGESYQWTTTTSNVIETTGRTIGIGTNNPDTMYAMDVNGEITTASLSVVSDARMKENIRPIVLSDTIPRPITFKYINFDSGTRHGFSAQDVKKEYADIVRDSSGELAVDYNSLIPLSVAWIQTLYSQQQNKTLAQT